MSSSRDAADPENSASHEEEVDDVANNSFIESLLAEHLEAMNGEAQDEETEDDTDDQGQELEAENGNQVDYDVEVEVQEEVEANAAGGTRNAPGRRTHSEPYIYNFIQNLLLILGLTVIGRRQLMQLLQNPDVGRLFRFIQPNNRGDDDDDDDDDYDDDDDDSDGESWIPARWGRGRRAKPDPNRFPKVPSEAGTSLMKSGIFGSDEAHAVTSNDRSGVGKKKKLATRILDRELAINSLAKQKLNQRLMAQGMIPASNADVIIHYDQPVYSGQFSDDGNFFFSANKDYKVRMYDTSNPYNWRYYKTVEFPFGQWTLTDASLSPDNKYLAYTSIQSTVCLAPTDPNDKGDPYSLDLSGREERDPGFLYRRQRPFGIWSIRFSGDGRELVAGATGGSIVVFDIESRRVLHRIFGHSDDVNAVCFADKASPHILYSGSDDTTLKVWDTRSMGDSRAAGAFIGHIEGLTYIDSKGDGRYVLSNGKDQSMKLWDLRMVMPSGEFERIQPSRRVATDERFDYRWGTYDQDDWYQDPHDNSVVTFRGHKVLRTLIRCHFSPAASTNSRYVYTGSEDGKVFIYNMDATIAGTVDVRAATKGTRPRRPGGPTWDYDDDVSAPWRTCVRDASWHPNAPMIVASAWNGYGMQKGTCTVHSWNDGAEEDEAEPKMGLRVNQELQTDPAFYEDEPRLDAAARQAMRRTMGLRNARRGY
ncbi:related to WD repeat protein [Rhynchosporium secalis]|uniref:Related to WD repeat protein n=1 Tax=Rhynchosporium secalis TaxID=38038 RepID=A0A1E1MPI7_RHYSE|nr:related to WD repeat protein [Rhynchosporium secalis]